MRVTLDTNILVSATISRGNEFKILELVTLGKFELILSLDIISEFRNVISRSKFGFSQKKIDDEVRLLFKLSKIVIPINTLNIIKDDPSDNKILECALAGKADYIISGDEHLLQLREYNGIKIMKTVDFLKLI